MGCARGGARMCPQREGDAVIDGLWLRVTLVRGVMTGGNDEDDEGAGVFCLARARGPRGLIRAGV